MSRPWMPLYVADYLADTGHLTAAEHGAYLLLIMHYWTRKGLPKDERQLARIARLSPEEWSASRDTLAALFGEGWTHKRIDGELARCDEISDKRRAAVQQRKDRQPTSEATNVVQLNTHARVVVTVDDKDDHKKEDTVPARENDYDRLHRALSEAAGEMPCAASPDISPIFAMIADGWSLDMQILPAIRDMALRKKRPTSWKYVAVTIRAQAEEARGRGPPPAVAMPATQPMKKVLVKWDTPQWWAWDAHLKATTGKGSPKSPRDDGWWFESEWPPKAEATA